MSSFALLLGTWIIPLAQAQETEPAQECSEGFTLNESNECVEQEPAIESTEPAPVEPAVQPEDKESSPQPEDTASDSSTESAVSSKDEPEAENSPDPNRQEFALLPLATFDSDAGLGVAMAGSVVKFAPDKIPFEYRLFAAGQFFIRNIPGQGVTVPNSGGFIRFDAPGTVNGKLRLFALLGYNIRNDMPYLGIGNQTDLPYDGIDETTTAYENAVQSTLYTQRSVMLDMQGQWSIYDNSTMQKKQRLELIFGGNVRYESPIVPAGSILERDIELAKTNPDMDLVLNGTNPHALMEIRTSIMWDTRDHEYVPQSGSLILLLNEFSPGIQEGLLYNQTTFDMRWYKALAGEYLVVANRVAGVFIAGSAPFYEMGSEAVRTDISPSVIGTLRGPRYNRYRGTRQAMTSLELRSKFLDFSLGSQQFNLGVTGFVETGRVWNAVSNDAIAGNTATDGWGLHTSVGGGPRIQWGETFIIRTDYGYSLSDETSRAFLIVSHAF